jgi:hypothetical protein
VAPHSAFELFSCANCAILTPGSFGFFVVSFPNALDHKLPNASVEGFAGADVYVLENPGRGNTVVG